MFLVVTFAYGYDAPPAKVHLLTGNLKKAVETARSIESDYSSEILLLPPQRLHIKEQPRSIYSCFWTNCLSKAFKRLARRKFREKWEDQKFKKMFEK